MGFEPRERRYIAEYMAQAFPFGNYVLNVPLGPIPEDVTAKYGLSAGARLIRPSRPRIDAVAWSKTYYYLIESKIREAKAALGDIKTYYSLALKTPDLPGYEGQEIVKQVVVPWALDWILVAAHDDNIRVEVFLPAWVEGYVRERQNYHTREYRIARDEKVRLRKVLGVD